MVILWCHLLHAALFLPGSLCPVPGVRRSCEACGGICRMGVLSAKGLPRPAQLLWRVLN